MNLMVILFSALRSCGLRRDDRDARDARAIAASGLFDASYYYLNGGEDVAAAGVEPIRHFCNYGWREGRRPNLFFDPLWYAASYLGAERDVNPFLHYLRKGERTGAKPICFFDPAWYRRTYRLPEGTLALGHYLTHRRTQRFAPNPDFDIAYYLDRHRDEIGPNRDPFMHHLRNGAALRDLDPSPRFDSAAYRHEVMAQDTREWVGLSQHEMRVPLVHRLYGLGPQRGGQAEAAGQIPPP